MPQLKNFVTPLHQATKRDYLARMIDDKVVCMLKAKEYEGDYWDGDRRYGYGGYKFIDGRWKPVAEALISDYKLTNDSSILDEKTNEIRDTIGNDEEPHRGHRLIYQLKINERNQIIMGLENMIIPLQKI